MQNLSHKGWTLMMLKKSSVSHTVFARSNNTCITKREDLTENTGVVLAKYPPKVKLKLFSQLQSARESKLCVPWFTRVFGFLQQQRVGLFSLEQKSFPYRSFLGRILRDHFHIRIPLRYHKTWRARHFLIYATVIGKQSFTKVVSLPYVFSLNLVSFRILSAS